MLQGDKWFSKIKKKRETIVKLTLLAKFSEVWNTYFKFQEANFCLKSLNECSVKQCCT